MSKKMLYSLMAALLTATVLLAACGGQATPTSTTAMAPTHVAVTETKSPAQEATQSDQNHECGLAAYERAIECNGNIASVEYLEGELVILSEVQVTGDGNLDVYIDVHATDGNAMRVDMGACYVDGKYVSDFPFEDSYIVRVSSYITLRCSLYGTAEELKASVLLPRSSYLAATLTAMVPSTTPTATWTSTIAPVATTATQTPRPTQTPK